MTDFLQDNLRVFVVPVEIMDVQDLDIYEQMVYIVLRSFTNPREATAFPSYNTIAKLGRMSRRKAIDCVTSLTEKGLLKKEIRLDVTKNRKIRNTSNLYTVQSPKEKRDEHLESKLEQQPVKKPAKGKSNQAKLNTDATNPIRNLLKTHGIDVNDKIIAKWLKTEKEENIMLVIQDTLKRTDINNVVGYITRVLEMGYNPPKATAKELLPSYILNKDEPSKDNISTDQQKAALDLLFELQEINQVEYNKRLEKLQSTNQN